MLGGILLSKIPLLVLAGEITAWWESNPAVIAVQLLYFAIALRRSSPRERR